MKPLLVTSGEPAGIGPDICLSLAGSAHPLVILCDKHLLEQRASELNLQIELLEYKTGVCVKPGPRQLYYLSLPCAAPVISGQLNPDNSAYVIAMLSYAVDACLRGEFSGMVTAPVHKAVINQAGIPFTGHTEFLAERCKAATVVMMLSCKTMNVALVTTHLPLLAVPNAITQELIISVIHQLHQSLQNDFAITNPCILVTGLNPHAGEGGYLGREEIDCIQPALQTLAVQGIHAEGPFPADTLFTPYNIERADAFVAMYHDQGLTVLKYAGFGQAVNVSLGLPIIRTSVDHGTALELAGTGRAETSSLQAAVTMAASMAEKRQHP